MVPRFIARQLSHPTGFFGRIIVRVMNRHNANMNAFAVRQLAPARTDRVLEIGFGGGVTLRALIDASGFVAGLDRSRYVVDRARARFAGALRAGRAEFQVGEVQAIPFGAASFDRICTVNTVYFWRSLDQAFAEIRRVLAPGGRLVVGFLPKEPLQRRRFPPDVFTAHSTEEVVAAMTAAGFTDIRIERPREKTPWNVIVGG